MHRFGLFEIYFLRLSINPLRFIVSVLCVNAFEIQWRMIDKIMECMCMCICFYRLLTYDKNKKRLQSVFRLCSQPAKPNEILTTVERQHFVKCFPSMFAHPNPIGASTCTLDTTCKCKSLKIEKRCEKKSG